MTTRTPQEWWKYVHKKIQDGEVVSRRQVREIDNGFFEKFGEIVKQATQNAVLKESNPSTPVEEIEAGLQNVDLDKGINRYKEAVGWNIDKLYQEVLYSILHNVEASDAGSEVGQLAMFSYLQEAFKIVDEKHAQLLSEADAKKPPELMLNVDILEAKDLKPKDPNGLSDPFVKIFMISSPTQGCNSSVKQATLNPVWEEHFSLPMLGNFRKDQLCLEVWDYDPAESLKEKMNKLPNVKGVTGVGKLMKEITKMAFNAKDVNELIGSVIIPVKCIPPEGTTKMYRLKKKDKSRQLGAVKVRLNFSGSKNTQVAAQEHRHLLQILLLHELENSKVAPYWWSGNYSAPAEAILTQHAAQSGLSQQDNHLAQWAVFCAVTADHPLSFALFNTLLDKIHKPVKSGLINENDVKLFWDGTRKLLPYCYSHIKKPSNDSLQEVLKILLKISELEIPNNIDLFPKNLYSWLRDDNERMTIHDVLEQAVQQGASDRFAHIAEKNDCKNENEELRLQYLTTLIELIHSDIENADKHYERVFVDLMNFQYTKTLYGVYESKIALLFEAEVKELCIGLKRQHDNISFKTSVAVAGGVNGDTGLNKLEAMGSTLFGLYRKLQRFLELGQNLNKANWKFYAISTFHTWFFEGVAQWLNIFAFMAQRRVGKAVELDTLTQVDSYVKYSSSSVDTLTVFFQIKRFWEQLAWPDVEDSYMFLTKLVYDICRCLVFYSDRMASRVDNIGMETTVYGEKFKVTTEWCVAINNIEYVQYSLERFLADLGINEIVQKISEVRSPDRAQKCESTIRNVIESAVETVQCNIVALLKSLVKKMMPTVNQYLVEGTEFLHQDCSSMEPVMQYLDANLKTLYQHLKDDNFSTTLDIMWDQLGKVLYELIQGNIKKRPPSFFGNFHKCLKIMMTSFRQNNKKDKSSQTLESVEYLLKIHGMETRELIHQYHLERLQEQQAVTEPKMGILTVRAQFIDDNLKIEIMNARNLASTDSSGCNSYVRVRILPEDTFIDVLKLKTQTHSKNIFPLYDETFIVPLSHEQRSTPDGLLHFVVKDKDMFSMSNAFVGEAYLHFSEIPDTPAPISSLPQSLLTLTRPARIAGDATKVLESRQGDKQARQFLKRQRKKISYKKLFFSLS